MDHHPTLTTHTRGPIRSGTGRRRSPWTGVAALSAAALLAAGTAAPAAAHDQLIEAVPGTGTTIVDTPSTVELTFSGNLTTGQGIANLATVTDDAGHQWQDGEATVSGPTLTAELCEGMPNGVYEVDYRVVYSDGHSEEKMYTFTLQDPAAPESGAPTDCGVPNPDAPVSSDGTADGTTDGAADGAASDAGSGTSSGDAGSAASTGAATPEPAADGAEPAEQDATASAEATAETAQDQLGLPGWVWPTAIGGLLVIVLALVLVFRKTKAIDGGSAE